MSDYQIDTSTTPTLGVVSGYALRWSDSAAINSPSEGRFVETFHAGAFDRDLASRAKPIPLMWSHGHGVIGDLPLAALQVTPDSTGLHYRGRLIDSEFARSLAGSLRSGLLGSSIRFGLIRDRYTPSPGRDESNPAGLPRRHVTEARLLEVSAVVWPAYGQSTATLRAITLEPIDTTLIAA
jgi:uncharacterized protein